jgi:hypothetical protein
MARATWWCPMTADARPLAGTRDASWYACPGKASVYHVAVKIDGTWMPACNTTLRHGHMAGHKGAILVDESLIDAKDARSRCARRGCKQRWP